jgi:hypothetical protein
MSTAEADKIPVSIDTLKSLRPNREGVATSQKTLEDKLHTIAWNFRKHADNLSMPAGMLQPKLERGGIVVLRALYDVYGREETMAIINLLDLVAKEYAITNHLLRSENGPLARRKLAKQIHDGFRGENPRKTRDDKSPGNRALVLGLMDNDGWEADSTPKELVLSRTGRGVLDAWYSYQRDPEESIWRVIKMDSEHPGIACDAGLFPP